MNIVIVDDDSASALLSKMAIQQADSNCIVTVLHDGDQLLNHLRHSEDTRSLPDLILLDLNLPRLSGKEVLKVIKTHDAYKRIPTVVLSGSQNMEDIVDSLNLYANCFVKKEQDYTLFTNKITSLLHYWQNVAVSPHSKSFRVEPSFKEKEQTDGAEPVA